MICLSWFVTGTNRRTNESGVRKNKRRLTSCWLTKIKTDFVENHSTKENQANLKGGLGVLKTSLIHVDQRDTLYVLEAKHSGNAGTLGPTYLPGVDSQAWYDGIPVSGHHRQPGDHLTLVSSPIHSQKTIFTLSEERRF